MPTAAHRAYARPLLLQPDRAAARRMSHRTVDWGAGVAFYPVGTLCGHEYRDGIAPHSDW
jgi:hypothetical protein